ncbi:unnamed protein product, partial [Adineta steineri]
MVGGQVIILHPYGQLDMELFSKTITHHQVSYLGTVPSQMINLTKFLNTTNRNYVFETLRCVSTGGIEIVVKVQVFFQNFSFLMLGESLFVGTVVDIQRYLKNNCQIYNYYGPTECTEAAVEHLIKEDDLARGSIPLGQPMTNIYIYVVDKYFQPIIPGMHMGEIIIGGAGVFAGYRSRNELTAQAMCQINDELCYKTGDLGCFNPQTRCFEYCGREDYQVKLRGQRIELSEIESVIMSITAMCVVVKVVHRNNDYLVAYVEEKSYSVNEEQLRQHCQSHLPPHMIPSFFIILDKLPLNQNGKIDRKLLPSPDYSSPTVPSLSEFDTPVNQVEKSVYDIWCQVLEHNGHHISTTTNFFTIGGHSRLFIELYHRYQTIFGFDSRTLSISPLLEQPTIQQHAKLLKAVTTDDIRREQWYTLHINQSMASFAQERIFLDEQIRFSNKHIFYNNSVALRVTEGVLSINRVLQALQLVLRKHEILRTSLVFNNDDSTLQQYVIDNHNTFTFLDQQTFESDNELQNIIYRTVINPDLFDLSSGRVFSCQILQQQKTTYETAHTDFLEKSDVLVLYFHHAAVDGTSIPILLNDFYNAYSNNMTISFDEQSVQYIDYAIYERLMDMTSSRSFWYSQLERFNLKRALKLPADRHRLSTVQRSGLASIAQISFDKELSMMFLNYASLHQITPFQLGLAAFYVFLLKLTHGETDLCIASINAN